MSDHELNRAKADFKNGVRYAVTWLRRRAGEMNDPWAKTVLNTAGFHLGVELAQGEVVVPDRDMPAALDALAEYHAKGGRSLEEVCRELGLPA